MFYYLFKKKKMLKHAEKWDQVASLLLWPIREVSTETKGTLPFQLLHQKLSFSINYIFKISFRQKFSVKYPYKSLLDLSRFNVITWITQIVCQRQSWSQPQGWTGDMSSHFDPPRTVVQTDDELVQSNFRFFHKPLKRHHHSTYWPRPIQLRFRSSNGHLTYSVGLLWDIIKEQM